MNFTPLGSHTESVLPLWCSVGPKIQFELVLPIRLVVFVIGLSLIGQSRNDVC